MFKKISDCLRTLRSYPGEYIRYLIAERLASWIYPKYKFSEYGRIVLDDTGFLDDFRAQVAAGNFRSFDRKYTMKELLNLVAHLDGDTAECGAYQGASSYFICRCIEGTGKKFLVFDSFEGLSKPDQKIDGRYWVQSDLVSPESIIRAKLEAFPFVEYYKGWIPDRFPEAASRRFCFLHVDVDLCEPTLESLKFFYPRMVTGGIILCDDYGFVTCPGAKKAMDSFFADKPEKIVSLPTGQGLIIKQ